MEKFTLFVGLNDGKTGRQLVKTADAKKIIIKISLEYVAGLTISDAVGVYLGEREKSLRIEYLYTDAATVEKIAGLIKKALNQNAVIIQHEEVNLKEI